MEVDSSELYNYVNDDVLNEFQGAGLQTLLQFIEAPPSSDSDPSEIIGTIFTELLMVLQEDKLQVEAMVEFLGACIRDEDTAMIFCQVVNIFPVTSTIEELIKQLYASQKIIKTATMAKYISGETMGKLGIIPHDALTRQLNIRKRDEFYTQKKFNLFHEEPEGFAKLIVEYCNILESGESAYQVDKALEITDKIIGHYNLDPSRVFDVFFECAANSMVSNIAFILGFLKKSRWWPLTPSDNSSLDSLSNGGNEELAKVVGLKLIHLSKGKSIPETFKLLTAILIKEGFFSFGSLYKFFCPKQESMDTLEQLYKKKLEDEVFKSSANALALAAPLKEEEEDEEQGKPNGSNGTSTPHGPGETFEAQLLSNLNFQMLRAFLTIGVYWPSIFILSKYPFLALIDDDTSTLITRLYHHMISPLNAFIQPFTDNELSELQAGKKLFVSRRNNEVAIEDGPLHTFLTFKGTMQDFNQKKFVFFYEPWKDQLPMINNANELFVSCGQLLKFLNVSFAKDVTLFSKICDFGVYDLQNGGDKDAWFVFYRNFIFPAISLLEGNSIAVDKAFKVLSFYPKEDRFNLYSEFHQVTSKNNPYIKITYGKAEKSTKDVLKRLSKETIKPMMRRIAKISFANPLPCFLTILQQIESYDNLNSLVVETARYFNAYGWDVLTLAIMIRITVSGRSNIQNNGLFERQWIQSLASFIGKICSRYPNLIEISVLLEFLLKSLHAKDTTGLIVLKEMLQSMGGLTSSTNLTLDQIYKLNSGDILKKNIYTTIHDTRYENVKSGSILVKNMIDLDCVTEFLVLFCQLDASLTYEEDETHLKVLANRKDELMVVTQLFCDLLNFVAKDQSSQFLQPVSDLVTKYNVPPEWAFEVWRKYLDSQTGEFSARSSQITSYLSDEIWDKLSAELYFSFWQFSLYDINYIASLYSDLLGKQKSQLPGLESTYNRSRRTNKTRQEIEEALQSFETARDVISAIEKDDGEHKEHAELINKRFEAESSSWLRENDSIELFIQYCVLPRCVHSSFDAVYSAKFIFKIFEYENSFHSIFSLLDKLISSGILYGTFFTSTLMESENLGIFFCELLSTLSKKKESFKADEQIYKQYKEKIHKYHVSMLTDLSKALKSTDYMCRRNSIIFLKNIVSIYPAVEDHCEALVVIIERIIATEDREDLKLAANALIGHLKSRKNAWVHLWDFVDLSEDQLTAQKEKRQKILQGQQEKERKEKERKEALAKAEQQRLAKIKAEKEKAEKEKKEKERLTYSEDSSQTRPISRERNEGGSKNDYYSKYAQVKAPSGPGKVAEGVKKVEPRAVSSTTGTNGNRNDRTSYAPSKKPEIQKDAPAAPSAPKVVAKQPSGESKTRQPLPPQSSIPKERKDTAPPAPRQPLPPQSAIPKDTKSRNEPAAKNPRREPLAPQHSTVASRTAPIRRGPTYDNRSGSHDNRGGNYNRDNGWYNNQRPQPRSQAPHPPPQSRPAAPKTSQVSSKDPLPPPPPPPPPPAAPAGPSGPRAGGLRDNKRKFDYNQGNDRPYDKRYKR